MTNARIRMAVAGVVFYVASGTTVEAAKGVKKVIPANSQRTISGVVMNFTHNNVSGVLHVRTAHHHRKRGVVNAGNVAGVNNQGQFGHTLNVTSATRVTHWNGTPVSAAALHRGERVRVHAMGQQALHVHILSQNRMRGYLARHRVRMYQPNRMNLANRMMQPNTIQQANNAQLAKNMQHANHAQHVKNVQPAKAMQQPKTMHPPNHQKQTQHAHRR